MAFAKISERDSAADDVPMLSSARNTAREYDARSRRSARQEADHHTPRQGVQGIC
jgi:hypothetical protein